MKGIQIQPLDDDLFIGNTASIFDSTKEGSFLAQALPTFTHTPTNKFSGGTAFSRPQVHGISTSNPFSRDSLSYQSGPTSSNFMANPAHQVQSYHLAKKNGCLLLEASKLGNFELCRQIIHDSSRNEGIDINYAAEDGWTSLHFACLNGNTELLKLLLEKNANSEAVTSMRYTALHIGAQMGHLRILEALISSRVKMNSQDALGNTPLHYACQKG